MRFKLFIQLFLLGVLFYFMWPVKSAQAVCTRCCNCQTVHNYIVDEITAHETWLKDEFWTNYLEPALSTMTNQITSHMASQTATMGTFIDAQNNMDAVRSIQEMQAQTASTYFTSEQLCRFASLSQSLAASDQNARATKLHLIERSQARQLGTENMVAANGGTSDMHARMVNYIGRYCDMSNNNNQMKSLCPSQTDDRFLNADMDYIRSFDSKPTLDVNFGNTAASDDEKNILALSDNLFASDLFNRIEPKNLKGDEGKDPRVTYMDMRALIAKRSVAENSFATMIGQKSQGAAGSKEFIAGILKELGVSDEEALSYLGGTPSYDAQMEVLTKKIYQSPSFYVNLMENPANIERQYAAMQSFGLMQQRDLFDSITRSEMLLSLIVELEVAKYQDEAQALMDK